ncbi:hypothetical protein EMCRGX_G033688 [Ephydatia muelleri]
MCEQFAAAVEPCCGKPFETRAETGNYSEAAGSCAVDNGSGSRVAAEGASQAKSVPSRKVRSTDPSVGVKRAIDNATGVAACPPITVGERFKSTVSRAPDRPALCYKEAEEWREVTYGQYYALCMATAKSLLKLGLQPYSGVAILGFNSPEWMIASLGAIFAGGIAAGIYTTNSPEACQFVAHDCKANVLVVEDGQQLQKILQIRDQLPHLKAIVQYKGKLSQQYPNVLEWDQFMELGKDVDDSVIEEKIKAQRPEQCALVVYTSGTTGNPKGVMLSHDNLTWMTTCLSEMAGDNSFGVDKVVSYLPLSHIAAQISDLHLAIHHGGTVYFAQPDALKGNLLSTLRDVQPTVFLGVPKVYETIMEHMIEASRSITGFKRKVSLWAKQKGLQGNRHRELNRALPWGWWLADQVLFKRVREALGLNQCRVFFSGAASLSRDTVEYFMGVNIPILELYGMSESTGSHSVNLMGGGRWRVGSAGQALVGTEMKIHCPDENGDGEILLRGRHVFMGYLNCEQKTVEAIDDEGWLHTGDVGRVDRDGFLTIMGRIKELIFTFGGTTISPVVVENVVKKEIPFLNHVMLIGDRRHFLVCLLTIKTIINADTGEPTDVLAPQAQRAIEQLGSPCTRVSQIIETKDRAVFTAIQQGLDRVNNRETSNAHRIHKWSILPVDFSVAGDELGPTLKVKRQVVLQKYADTIEDIYA